MAGEHGPAQATSLRITTLYHQRNGEASHNGCEKTGI
jgi:hypothetical protein